MRDLGHNKDQEEAVSLRSRGTEVSSCEDIKRFSDSAQLSCAQSMLSSKVTGLETPQKLGLLGGANARGWRPQTGGFQWVLLILIPGL